MPKPTPPPIQLRIVTFNTWRGLDYRHPYLMLPIQSPRALLARYRAQRAALRQLASADVGPRRLDVFHLQELNPLSLRLRFLKKTLSARARGALANAGVRAGLVGIPLFLSEGLGTFFRGGLRRARWSSRALSGKSAQLTGPGGIPLFFQLSERRVALKLRGRVGGLRVSFFQAHLHAGPGEGESSARRSQEIEHLAAWIAPEISRGDLVFLSGDFNNDPDSPENAPLRALGLVSPCHETTWSPATNDFCHFPSGGTRTERDEAWDRDPHGFDRVYFWRRPGCVDEKTWKIKTRRVLDQPGLSDHYGILADIEFSPPSR